MGLESNYKYIQTFQNKIVSKIVNGSWYARNSYVHRNLGIPFVKEEKTTGKHEPRLREHTNAAQILGNQNKRRLKSTKQASGT